MVNTRMLRFDWIIRLSRGSLPFPILNYGRSIKPHRRLIGLDLGGIDGKSFEGEVFDKNWVCF